MAKILIIEDDTSLAKFTMDWLAAQGHIVETVADGEDGMQMVNSFVFDLIVLDLNLPGMSGLTILENFRAGGGMTPVLILTGQHDPSDKETGLDAGADDYLTKPFNAKELAARVRALLRRPAQTYIGDVLTLGDLTVDCKQHKVKRGSEEIKLLPKEFELLEFFLRNPNRVFSPEALLEGVWSSQADASADAVKSAIKRLRRKIDVEGRPSFIQSIYGVGYELQTAGNQSRTFDAM
jgi:two-component system OmpR family response regulator